MAALYTPAILRLATTIPFLERLPAPHASVEKRAPVCGSRVAVDVKLDKEGRISALGLLVNACALGQASANLMASHALGRTPAELAEARDALAAWLAGESGPGDWPGLDVLAPALPHRGRHAAIRLPFEAVADAARLAAAERVG